MTVREIMGELGLLKSKVKKCKTAFEAGQFHAYWYVLDLIERLSDKSHGKDYAGGIGCAMQEILPLLKTLELEDGTNAK
jgi:hypothetical protein